MGVYDTVVDAERDRETQVKLWGCESATYTFHSIVPRPEGNLTGTYSVAVREGGFLNVVGDALLSWTDEPLVTPVYDKWGRVYNRKTTTGLLENEDYFFSEGDL